MESTILEAWRRYLSRYAASIAPLRAGSASLKVTSCSTPPALMRPSCRTWTPRNQERSARSRTERTARHRRGRPRSSPAFLYAVAPH